MIGDPHHMLQNEREREDAERGDRKESREREKTREQRNKKISFG